jgi:hypothetical protein
LLLQLFSEVANGDQLAVFLLATVPSTSLSFSDDASTSVNKSVTPKNQGELGQWHVVASLSSSRTRVGCVIAPRNTTSLSSNNRYYIYAFGGISSGTRGTVLSSIEYAYIDVVAATTATDSDN